MDSHTPAVGSEQSVLASFTKLFSFLIAVLPSGSFLSVFNSGAFCFLHRKPNAVVLTCFFPYYIKLKMDLTVEYCSYIVSVLYCGRTLQSGSFNHSPINGQWTFRGLFVCFFNFPLLNMLEQTFLYMPVYVLLKFFLQDKLIPRSTIVGSKKKYMFKILIVLPYYLPKWLVTYPPFSPTS